MLALDNTLGEVVQSVMYTITETERALQQLCEGYVTLEESEAVADCQGGAQHPNTERTDQAPDVRHRARSLSDRSTETPKREDERLCATH